METVGEGPPASTLMFMLRETEGFERKKERQMKGGTGGGGEMKLSVEVI